MALEVEGVRSKVIRPETKNLLEEFLAFRHVFRNVYGYNLTREKLEDLIQKLPEVSRGLERNIKEFEAKMMDLYGL